MLELYTFYWKGDEINGSSFSGKSISNVYCFITSMFILFYRYLKKIKRERKLTGFEITMYIMTQLAYFIWAATTFLEMLSE